MRAILEITVARTAEPEAMENHFQLGEGPVSSHRLADITAPTLVVQGDEDPVFPLGHGQALAEEIPGADLLVIRALGHEMPPRIWGELVEAVVRHTTRPN